MSLICEPAAARVTRLSAEDFCRRICREASGFYRPRSEVVRMLVRGEAWGVAAPQGGAETALTLLPLGAELSAAAALRALMGWRAAGLGMLLGPPVGRPEQLPELLRAAGQRALRKSRGGPVWAVLECTPEAEELVPLYLEQGFALRGLGPLNSLAPCWLFLLEHRPRRGQPVWVPLADRGGLALWLSRGWGAVSSRPGREGPELELCPAE